MVATPKPAYKAPPIATRADEVNTIVGVLEGDYDDAKKAARAVLGASFKLMAERDWFAIASFLDGAYPTFYGVFATEAAALKALEQNSLGLFGKAQVVQIRGLTVRQKELDKWEGEPRYGCAECGHDEYAHNWPRSRVPGCAIAACGCPTYTKPLPTIARIALS